MAFSGSAPVSPAEPERGIFGWIKDAIRRIDFSSYNLLDDFFIVSHATYGGMTLSELSDMEWMEYQYAVDKAQELLKLMQGQ